MYRKRILYIDDHPDHLSMVQHLLENELAGVAVDVCCTSRGAEEFLNRYCYDVVISDVCLPGELGTDIAEKILERDAEQPIYLMTEYIGDKFHAEAARLGLELHQKFSSREMSSFIDDIRKMLDQRPCDPNRTVTPRDSDSPATKANSPAGKESVAPKHPIRLTSPHIIAARAAKSAA